MSEVDLNYLLLGKTGQGKSATGNTILNRSSYFKVSSSSTSKTKEVNDGFAMFDRYKFHVVDAPGLMDTDMDDAKDKETVAQMMDQALAKCYDSIDAFLYVIKFGNRFTEEDRSALQALKAIFGDDFLKHVIVVMTAGDNFQDSMLEEYKDNSITFEQWCSMQVRDIQYLYDNCNKRFVLFNNREKDECKNTAQKQQLIEITLKLKSQQGCYTSQCFQDAGVQREKLILEKKAPHLRKEIQEKISLLSDIIEKLQGSPSEKEVLRIRTQINDTRAAIKKIDNGEDVLQDIVKLLDIMEGSLRNVVKLHSLTKELESIRQAKSTWIKLEKVVDFIGGFLHLLSTKLGKAADFVQEKICDRIKSLSDNEGKKMKEIEKTKTTGKS